MLTIILLATILSGDPGGFRIPTIKMTAERMVVDSLDTLYTLRISGSMTNQLQSILIGVDQIDRDENLILPKRIKVKASEGWRLKVDEIEESDFTAIMARPLKPITKISEENSIVAFVTVPNGVQTNIGSCFVTFREARNSKYSTNIILEKRKNPESQFESDSDHTGGFRSQSDASEHFSEYLSHVKANDRKVNSIISRISSADSIIIAANLVRCSDKNEINASERCLVDFESIKCVKRNVSCNYLSWIKGMYSQTVIKVIQKTNKALLETFIQSYIDAEAKERGSGGYGCQSIDGILTIYSKDGNFDLEYDGMNRSLNGVKMKNAFWEELLKRYTVKAREKIGC